MGNIIPLHGDPHALTQELMPWYVNGTLDAGERQVVAEHLADCEECRAEFAQESALARAFVDLPHEEGEQWSGARARALASARARPARGWAQGMRGRPGRWALIAASQVAVIGLTVAIYSRAAAPPEAEYHALSSAPAAVPAGNVIVIFRPDLQERTLRDTLHAVDARIVDGPTAADAYVLAVAPERLDLALAALRARPDIVLAQPIDTAIRP